VPGARLRRHRLSLPQNRGARDRSQWPCRHGIVIDDENACHVSPRKQIMRFQSNLLQPQWRGRLNFLVGTKCLATSAVSSGSTNTTKAAWPLLALQLLQFSPYLPSSSKYPAARSQRPRVSPQGRGPEKEQSSLRSRGSFALRISALPHFRRKWGRPVCPPQCISRVPQPALGGQASAPGLREPIVDAAARTRAVKANGDCASDRWE
jgi:hypothetical protein